MGNVFKYEFKMYAKSILIWVASIVLLLVSFMAFFPAFSTDATLLDKMLENYPPELLKAFGMGGTLSLATVLGYFAFIFTFLQLCLAVQAANYGFSILSVEEREFTADYLMSKPVSRQQILIAKFSAALCALTLTNASAWIGSFLAITLFQDGKSYEVDKLILLLATIVLFQLFFLTVGMVISVMVRRIRNVLSFSLGLAFGTYILNTVRAIVGGETLGYFSPFYHFDPAVILEKGNLNIPMVSISVSVVILSIIATFALYSRRDINSL